jgi:hypothetical protein
MSSTHQRINQRINASTYQHDHHTLTSQHININPPVPQHINTIITTVINTHINTSIMHQHIKSLIFKPEHGNSIAQFARMKRCGINIPTYQHLDTSTHQHINSSPQPICVSPPSACVDTRLLDDFKPLTPTTIQPIDSSWSVFYGFQASDDRSANMCAGPTTGTCFLSLLSNTGNLCF